MGTQGFVDPQWTPILRYCNNWLVKSGDHVPYNSLVILVERLSYNKFIMENKTPSLAYKNMSLVRLTRLIYTARKSSYFKIGFDKSSQPAKYVEMISSKYGLDGGLDKCREILPLILTSNFNRIKKTSIRVHEMYGGRELSIFEKQVLYLYINLIYIYSQREEIRMNNSSVYLKVESLVENTCGNKILDEIFKI